MSGVLLADGGLWQVLSEPWHYDFMLKALGVATLVALVCGVLSCYLALRGWSLLGDALSHAVLPGVVVAAIFGLPFVAGAAVAAAIAVGGIGLVRANTRVKPDVAIGVVFTSMFALGYFLRSMFPTGVDVQSILLGNLLGITDADAMVCAWIGAGVLLVLAVKWKDLLVAAFDPGHARAIGLPVGVLSGLLLALMALATVAAMQAVGAALVVAMLITPGATAFLLTERFGRMVIIASATAVFSAAAGVTASYYLNGAPGGCIITVQTALFLLALVLAPRHGLLAARRGARDLRDRTVAGSTGSTGSSGSPTAVGSGVAP